MRLPELSIKRPIFVTCLVFAMLVIGYISLKRLPIDLFPDITFPVVTITIPYSGAGPKEVETLVSKPVEEEMSSLPGIKTLRSINKEGVSTVVALFTLETDIKYAEQQVRDRMASAKRRLPKDIDEPVIRRLDPADQPVVIVSLSVPEGQKIDEGKLFDIADDLIKPKLEQVPQVGKIEVVGGRKREVRVELDRTKLKDREVSASMVAARIASAGQDVPLGKFDQSGHEVVFRALGEFKSLDDIRSTVVSFLGNDVPVTVADVGRVVDDLEEEKLRAAVNGQKALLLMVFRQTGSNTIAVVDSIKTLIPKLNEELKRLPGAPTLVVERDTSKMIRANIDDVKESIFFGIVLTIVVVFFFLGNGRSTLITGLALPNSLLGAFVLMSLAGFTINVMTLLALSLAVGLLIDDAIVVRENIFRRLENGESAMKAAINGTAEVALAVIATTLAVIAVFGPIAFLQGVVGQFFKEFGLTICFAMAISLFDAFTMAPMLSAYFAGSHEKKEGGLWYHTIGRPLRAFGRFQDWLDNKYVGVLGFTLRRPIVVIGSALVIFVVSLAAAGRVPKTFLPAQDFGEFQVSIDLPPGTSLAATSTLAAEIDSFIRKNEEIKRSIQVVGGNNGEPNVAQFYIELVSHKLRKVNTSQMKDRLREQLKKYAHANPVVKDVDSVGGGERPFNVNIVGSDLAELEKVSAALFAKVKNHPALKDVEISHKAGKPEFQVVLDPRRGERLGVSSVQLGTELRTQIEGTVPALFRETGREYDIRVRLLDEQRNLRRDFSETYVPNINNALIRLPQVAKAVDTEGPSTINRQDRGRYIQISADLAPDGPGMGGVMQDITQILTVDAETKLPPGMKFAFVGQAENFKELMVNMLIAIGLAILFIYLVLASLYESFVIPFTIMLVLPLAAVGAFFALFVTGKSLDIFSMIGCIMLMGIATKNSILLVDYANQMVAQGKDRATAMLEAGKTRLRPILMTTVALIAGMLPVAIGLNEASRQRTSMGVAIIGGLISSTVLSLLVVPAAYSYIDRFRIWSRNKLASIFIADHSNGHAKGAAATTATKPAEDFAGHV